MLGTLAPPSPPPLTPLRLYGLQVALARASGAFGLGTVGASLTSAGRVSLLPLMSTTGFVSSLVNLFFFMGGAGARWYTICITLQAASKRIGIHPVPPCATVQSRGSNAVLVFASVSLFLQAFKSMQ